MTVADLIERLQALPQDMRVMVRHPGQCCCGECFLPHDEYVDPDPSPQPTSACCPGGTGETTVIL